MTSAKFDSHAPLYDDEFSRSLLGRHFREQVQTICEEKIEFPLKNCLEINGGTGIDALWLSNNCDKVTCTDQSKEMIKIAEERKVSAQKGNITYGVLDIADLNTCEDTYDLIFSNFGGLNCLDDQTLTTFFQESKLKTCVQGKLALVIMPDFCFSESLYFFIKGRWKSIFRRRDKGKGRTIEVSGEKISTYFHSPSKVKKLAPDWNVDSIHPIGFFLPIPSLSKSMEKRPGLFKWLKRMDKKTQNNTFLARWADHYLILLSKK